MTARLPHVLAVASDGGLIQVMDDMSIISQILPSLGAFAPVSILGWWLINRMNKQIEDLQKRNDALTDRVFTLGQSQVQVLAELRASLKG